MKNTGKFTLRLSQEHLEFLKALAIDQDRSVSSVIRMLIHEKQTDQVRQVRKTNGI